MLFGHDCVCCLFVALIAACGLGLYVFLLLSCGYVVFGCFGRFACVCGFSVCAFAGFGFCFVLVLRVCCFVILLC